VAHQGFANSRVCACAMINTQIDSYHGKQSNMMHLHLDVTAFVAMAVYVKRVQSNTDTEATWQTGAEVVQQSPSPVQHPWCMDPTKLQLSA